MNHTCDTLSEIGVKQKMFMYLFMLEILRNIVLQFVIWHFFESNRREFQIESQSNRIRSNQIYYYSNQISISDSIAI